jgi:hypothetical protein
MNSAFEGLRPMVGLRRPGRRLPRRRRPTPGAERPERPISIGGRAFGRRLACADREGVFCVGGGRRLARSAWRGRFQSAGEPSADGWPAPTGEVSSASAEADAWRGAPGEADFNRRESLRPMVGLRRPGRCLLRRRRPTLGVERLERPISIGGRAFGRRLACADRGGVFCVGGGRRLARSAWRGRFQSAGEPSADGRPAPTGRVSSASAEADAWRAAPGKADFNRRESLRPTVGLRRPGKCSLRRRRPTLGAERLRRPISIGGRAFGRRLACADRESVLCVGGGRRLARSA